MIDLSDKKTLRISMYIVLFYSILQILSLTISFLQSYFNLRSPLLPDSLLDYIAFPLFFILPVFLAIFFLALRSILRNEFNRVLVIVLIALTILYFIFGSSIYGFIMDYNPYGN